MGTVWIRHVLELLIVFYQFIHQHFGIVEMNIIIAGAMYVQ